MKLLFLSLLVASSGFLLGQSYVLNGDAIASGNGCYSITPSEPWQNGTVWYTDQLNLSESFNLEFHMQFGTNDGNGADGMVFVLQTIGSNAIGNAGGGMGFEGFNNAFGIEFDTFDNSQSNNGDLAADHVAFLKNGSINHYSANNLAGPVQAAVGSTNIEDGQEHIIQVKWDANTQLISLYFDCMLRLSLQIDIINTIFGGTSQVFWGFTGATGGMFNQQQVCLAEYYLNTEDNYEICEGESLMFSASGNPDGTFSWSPASDLISPQNQTTEAFPIQSTTYCCNYTDLCGQTTQQCIDVEVVPLPIIELIQDTSICEGTTVDLEAQLTNNYSSLAWSTDTGAITSPTNSPQITALGQGWYTLEAIGAANECATQDSVWVEEIPLPQGSLANEYILCPEETILVQVVGGPYESVIWNNSIEAPSIDVSSGGNLEVTIAQLGCTTTLNTWINLIELPEIYLGEDTLLCSTDSWNINAEIGVEWQDGSVSSSFEADQAGIYIATYELSGCSTSDTVMVYVQEAIPLDLGSDLPYCAGDTITLTAESTGTWNTGIVDSSIEITEPGTYSLTVTSGPCTTSDAVDVIQVDPPSTQMIDSMTFCIGQQAFIDIYTENAATYVWSNGEEDSRLTPDSSGWYFVIVSNPCGELTDSVYVGFEDCDYSLFVPNSFSPDGDGINDVWEVKYYRIQAFEAIIFDRWGNEIFRTTDLKEPWTGNVYNGAHYAQVGIYAYVIHYTTPDDIVQTMKGHIVMIR